MNCENGCERPATHCLPEGWHVCEVCYAQAIAQAEVECDGWNPDCQCPDCIQARAKF
jgi:hypothetical protein